MLGAPCSKPHFLFLFFSGSRACSLCVVSSFVCSPSSCEPESLHCTFLIEGGAPKQFVMAAGKGSQPYALRLIEASLLIAILSFFLAYFWSQNGIPGGGQAIPGPLQEQLGDLGWSSTFDNGKGVTLYRYMWPAKGHARARVVLVHGHGTYTCYEFLKSIGQKQRVYYGSWVERMNELGISVAGIDLQVPCSPTASLA